MYINRLKKQKPNPITVLISVLTISLLYGCQTTTKKDNNATLRVNESSTAFSKSYMITNRSLGNNYQPQTTSDKITPVSGNGLYYFTAPGSYNNNPDQFFLDTSSGTAPLTGLPKDFFNSLLLDLLKTRASSNTNSNDVIGVRQAPMQLTIYIHGLANVWTSAVTSSMDLGDSLQIGHASWAKSPPPVPTSDYLYNGLVIGFSWPSADAVYSDLNYGAFNRETNKTEPTPNTRSNILQSVESFQTLMNIISQLKTALAPLGGLVVNIISHSEGNYMVMQGMEYISRNGGTTAPDGVVLLAADFNQGALQLPNSQSTNNLTTGISTGTGSASAIVNQSKVVTAFYSNYDDTLKEASELFKRFHNYNYLDRLGYKGPSSFSSGLPPLVFGIDSSVIVKGGTSDLHYGSPLYNDYYYGWIPKHETQTGDFDINPHGSYRYVPQILWVISQMLQFENLDKLYNVTQGPYPQSFIMQLDDPSTK